MTRRSRGAAGWADDRLRAAVGLNRALRKVFPDHWSFLLGEIALYCFVILLLTGTFLTLFFQPSMTQVIYHGSYTKLDGVRMSQAYASTLHISFDVRGGLLMRQIHHWAANLFVAAIAVHLLRVFFTGAFRRPRELNWLIGVVLFALAMAEGFTGYSLPDDLLSGTGLRIANGIVLSIPVAGTYLSYLLWGGPYPGTVFIPRLYIIHVLLIPGLLLALVTAHLLIMWHQKHTQFPGPGRTNATVTGAPLYPHFMAKTGAFFFFVFGALALLGAFAQINPVWLYGPYTPVSATAGSQPDWYIGWLEGALRLAPNWTLTAFGHTLALNVLIPGAVIPGLFLTAIAAYPFFEAWATGDRGEHHLLDRPRDQATRTGIGAAAVAFYGVLWAGGGNDVSAYFLHVPLYTTTWILRILLYAAPVTAFIITRRLCLGLQWREREELIHGRESGVITQLPSGGYSERRIPLPDGPRAVLAQRESARALIPPPAGGTGRPAALAQRLRAAMKRLYVAGRVPPPGPAQPATGNPGSGRAQQPGPARTRDLPSQGQPPHG